MKVETGNGIKAKGKFSKYAFKIIRAKDTQILTRKITTQPTRSVKQAEVRSAFSKACNNIKLTRVADMQYWKNRAKESKLPEINELFRFFITLYKLKPQLLLTCSQETNGLYQDDAKELIRYKKIQITDKTTEQFKQYAEYTRWNSEIMTEQPVKLQSKELTLVAAIRTPENRVIYGNDICGQYNYWGLWVIKRNSEYGELTYSWNQNGWWHDLRLYDKIRYSSDYVIILKLTENEQQLYLNSKLVKTTYNDIIISTEHADILEIDLTDWWTDNLKSRLYFFAIFNKLLTDDEAKQLTDRLKETYSMNLAKI